MIATSFGLGIVIGFIFFEITGLTAGGIIVPGYIALFIHEPLRIVITLFVSLITYGFTTFLSRHFIIFGKRRFLIMVMLGFLFRIFIEHLNVIMIYSGVELKLIGYIIPGIIANEYYRQGVFRTIASLTIVSSIVYFILQLLYF